MNKVAILWDCQNVRVKPEEVLQLLGFAQIYGVISYQRAYANWHSENLNFSTTFYKSGFDCINIPVLEKNAVDKKLESDFEKDLLAKPTFKTIFLVSKDKDFAELVKKAQTKNKTVIIMSESPANQIFQSFNIKCFLFQELPNLIANTTQPQSTSCQDKNKCQTTTSQGDISYQDAVKCLIEAIKACLEKEKQVLMNSLDKLMRENKKFPNYKGVASIIKSDGTRFSSFGKFIDDVVKDSKIKKQGQELFLVEEYSLAA